MPQTLEQKREYAAKWRERNRDKIREYAKDYYWKSPKHKENSNKATKAWYENNKEKALEKTSAYYYANKHKRKYWKSTSIPYLLLKSAKSRAKRKGLPFNLELTDIIIPEVCPILGIPLSNQRGSNKFLNPSLDRIVPEKGYVKNNIAVISLRANMLKNDMSLDTAKKIVAYLESHIIN